MLLAIALGILYIRGNLSQFFNYAIFGIGEFARSNVKKTLISILAEIMLIVFIVLVTFVIFKIVPISKEEKDRITTLEIFAIPMKLIEYPIMNNYHTELANLLFIILTIYIVFVIGKIYINKTIKDILICGKIVVCICMFLLTIAFSYASVQYYKSFERTEDIYYGAIFTEEQKENINNMCNYIKEKKEQGKDIKIISYKAMLYMSPLKINNKEMDLPFLGNLGKEGESGLINKISQLKNTEILITKDRNDMLWQESKRVYDYIAQNFEKIGEIEEFYIYKTKE